MPKKYGASAVLRVLGLAGISIHCAHGAAAELPVQLFPNSNIDVAIAAGAASNFTVDLPVGTAANLRLIQRSGFIDLELRHDANGDIKLRTESGIGGQAEVSLLASTASHWSVVLATRTGHGASTATVSLGPLHPAAKSDALRSSAFEHYAEAERLRFANVKESRVTAQSAEADTKTRDEYAAAEADYAAAADGCGRRRALIGRARLEVGRGNYGTGRSFAEGAFAAVCEGDVAERAQALKTVGMAAAYQGDYAASAEAAEQAAALYQQTGDLRYQGIVLGNLSDVYVQLGETNRALAAATGALHAAEASADSQGIVFSRKSIAAIHLARGELAAALRDYRLALGDLSVTPYPMIDGETWNDLGILYHRMGDYDQSLLAYAAAQKVWEKMHNEAGHADTLINQAQALLESNDTQGAVRAFDEALAIARADGLKGVEAGALRGLGTAYAKGGDMRDARGFFLHSLELARASGASAAESYALRAIADVDFREGHLTEARRNAESALQDARQAADRDGEAATLEQLARIRADGGELAEARALIDQALDIIETQRGQINDPSLRTSYFASMRAYPDTQIEILMRLEARFPNQGYAEAALAAAERARARSLQDMLAEKSIDVARALAPEIADEQREAEDRLNAAAVQFARAGSNAGDEKRRALAGQLDAASHALDEVRGRIRADDPHHADLLRPADLRVEDLQEHFLDENTAILEYWLGSHASYLWIVSRHSLRVVRLPPRAVIERWSSNLQSLCRATRRGTRAMGFDVIAVAESKHNEAIRQAAAAAARIVMPSKILRGLPARIVVVADAGLQGLPFGLLPAGSPGETVGAAHDLIYLPSIAILPAIRRQAGEGQREVLAIVAAPVLDSSGFPDLPYTRREADAIASLLPKDQVWLALGPNASRNAVMSADWRRFTTIHFAAHAVVDRSRPELSGIVLSPPQAGGTAQDGVLRVNDIYDLNMPVKLVVLSGCETAAGRGLDSEGVFSLARAFFYAGATRVLASLWPVEDRATAEFMRAFYQALLVEHSTAATALRVAQRRLSADARWASPYYWAGFVLQGDWD
jgi:CHAT domain-containing protein/tetratricopeptide (TPR) repeat protein